MLLWKWVLAVAAVMAIACCISNSWIIAESGRTSSVSVGLTSATFCGSRECERRSYDEKKFSEMKLVAVFGMALKVMTGVAGIFCLLMLLLPARKVTKAFAIVLIVLAGIMLLLVVAWYVSVQDSAGRELRQSSAGVAQFGFVLATLTMIGGSITLLVLGRRSIAATPLTPIHTGAAPVTAPTTLCRSCGNPLHWVAEHQRWYCYTEQTYV